VVVLAIAGCGRMAATGASAPAPKAAATSAPALTAPAIQVVPSLALNHSSPTAVRVLPARVWAVSFDLRLAASSRVQVDLGYGTGPLVFASTARGGVSLLTDGRTTTLRVPSGWLRNGSVHVEATNARVAIDGRAVAVGSSRGNTLSLQLGAGRADVTALIASAAGDRGALLLHRLAELHARIPLGQFPVGADRGDQIQYNSTYWTSGFWAGALWQAAALVKAGGSMFANWALAVTVRHFGQERVPTHDVGFEYGQSSLAAWEARCRGARPPAALCARLKGSVLSAADELMALAASNPVVGTIPINNVGPNADMIVDSTMNVAILPWATSVTGNQAYARLALHQAQVISSLLVRPDGSTAQAADFDRATGALLDIATHQGVSSASTWSRGQGWAVYGFAQEAIAAHDLSLLRVALRLAGYVQTHLPAGGIPPWDYDAPAGSPVDVSAGVITAAGLFHLATACDRLAGVCTDPSQWTALGVRMLNAALSRASSQPPLGLLGSQVLNERGRGCWCNGGELSFGLTYAIEALALEQSGGLASLPANGQSDVDLRLR
jgi:unsaturated chondroitin disaccharide hydrolase